MYFGASLVIARFKNSVMAGLVPAIHVLLADVSARKKDVDARHKAGHDEWIKHCDTAGAMPSLQTNVSYKSSHSGFIAWISFTFHARGQCLMFFSRWMAD